MVLIPEIRTWLRLALISMMTGLGLGFGFKLARKIKK
jgi:hypothetical protein